MKIAVRCSVPENQRLGGLSMRRDVARRAIGKRMREGGKNLFSVGSASMALEGRGLRFDGSWEHFGFVQLGTFTRAPGTKANKWSSSASGLLHALPVCSIRSSTIHLGRLSPLLHAFHDDNRCSPAGVHGCTHSAKPREEGWPKLSRRYSVEVHQHWTRVVSTNSSCS